MAGEAKEVAVELHEVPLSDLATADKVPSSDYQAGEPAMPPTPQPDAPESPADAADGPTASPSDNTAAIEAAHSNDSLAEIKAAAEFLARASSQKRLEADADVDEVNVPALPTSTTVPAPASPTAAGTDTAHHSAGNAAAKQPRDASPLKTAFAQMSEDMLEQLLMENAKLRAERINAEANYQRLDTQYQRLEGLYEGLLKSFKALSKDYEGMEAQYNRMKKLYDGMNETHGKVRRELYQLQKDHTKVLSMVAAAKK